MAYFKRCISSLTNKKILDLPKLKALICRRESKCGSKTEIFNGRVENIRGKGENAVNQFTHNVFKSPSNGGGGCVSLEVRIVW